MPTGESRDATVGQEVVRADREREGKADLISSMHGEMEPPRLSGIGEEEDDIEEGELLRILQGVSFDHRHDEPNLTNGLDEEVEIEG